MKYKITFVLIMFLVIKASSWGLTGHRVIGQIAEIYLSKKTGKEVKKIKLPEHIGEGPVYNPKSRPKPRGNGKGKKSFSKRK